MIKIFREQYQKLKVNSLGSVLIKGSAGAFLVNVISAAIAFGVQILLARLLGANIYGDYTYVISWILLLTLLGKLGIDTASLRYVSEYYVQGRWELLAGFLKRTSQIVLIVSIGIAFLVSVIIFTFWDYFGDNLGHLFILSALLLPLNSLVEVGGSYLRGLKYVITAIAPRAILHPLLLAMGVFGVFWVIGIEPSASMTIVINIVVTVITLIIIFYYLFKGLPTSVLTVKPNYLTKEWLNVSLPLFLISGLHLLLIRTDVLMIGAFIGTTDAGVYSAVSRITELVLFGQNSILFVFAPMISEMYAKRDKIELQRMVLLATGGIVVISLPVGIGLILLGEFILALFGPAFVIGYSTLVVLIFGQLTIAFVGTSGWLLSMTGHQRENAFVIGVGLILNILLNAILIPFWGIFGAAIATTVSTVTSNMFLAYLVWKRLKINPFVGALKLRRGIR